MRNRNVTLPTDDTMKNYCHLSPNRSLPAQAVALVLVLSFGLFVLFSISEIVAGIVSYVMGRGFPNNDGQPIAFYALCAGSTLTALAIFIKTYIHAQVGLPTFCTELEADLSQESVLHVCAAYLRSQAVDEVLAVDMERGRVVGLMRQTNLSATFLEITTIATHHDRTFIVVRAASLVHGYASLISAFYTDLGASREAAGTVSEIFSAYASRQRRKDNRISKQAIPVPKRLEAVPPPLLKGVHQFR